MLNDITPRAVRILIYSSSCPSYVHPTVPYSLSNFRFSFGGTGFINSPLVGAYNITQLKEICMCVRLSAWIGATFRCASLVCRLDERSPDFEVHDVIVFEYAAKRQTSFFEEQQILDRRAQLFVTRFDRLDAGS